MKGKTAKEPTTSKRQRRKGEGGVKELENEDVKSFGGEREGGEERRVSGRE